MRFNYYKYFHQLTTDRSDGGTVFVPVDRSKWPREWKEVNYKEYTFFKEMALPVAEGYFFDTLASKRSSSSQQLLQNKLSLTDIAYMLKCGYGLQHDVLDVGKSLNHRTVPSAGARYPLEIYVVFFDEFQTLPAGIYHYNIRQHALEVVQQRDFGDGDKRVLSPLPWFTKAHGLFCVSGVFQRTVGKYGIRGYRYILLEAGHVAQNMQLAATERNSVLVPTGGVEDCAIERLIGLDDSRERLMYTLCF